jgi:SAM-dependent methyltransferase
MPANLSAWETAELQRSAFEAVHTPAERLIADERNVARYLAPPVDTVYPLEYAFALLGDVREKTVLDFGCGSGENTLVLVRRGAKVIGVDLSPHLIELARRRLAVNHLDGQTEFIVGSAHDLPVADNRVDVVFGIAILHHLDLDLASREVHRVLKPGGRAIFMEPVRDSRVLRAVRRCIPYRAPDVSPFERPLTTRELQQFGSRFASMESRGFSLPFVNLVQALPPLQRYVHPAYHLDGAILKRMPALRHFAGGRVIQLHK